MHKYATHIRSCEKRKVQMRTLQLRNQQPKTISFMYRFLYKNFRVTANQKSTIDVHAYKKINSNTTLR